MTDKKIGYAFNIVADVGNGKQFSISTNFDDGATEQEINDKVDMLRKVFDRQQAKSASLGASQEIEQLKLRHKAAEEDLAMLDTKAEAKGGLSAAERQQREAATVHIRRMHDDIVHKTKVLNDIKKEAE